MDNEQKALELDKEARDLLIYGKTLARAKSGHSTEVFSEVARLQLNAQQLRATTTKERMIRISNEDWELIGRYIKEYPDDLHLVFKKGDVVLDIPNVPDLVWCAFDGVKLRETPSIQIVKGLENT